jgi:hypothetical protein
VNQAQVQGFVVATGTRGKIVLGGAENKVTGVLLAPEIWLAGVIHGSVVASRLRCGERDGGLNCLGDAVIDREALPGDFVQPWEFGLLGDRSQIRFKLLSRETL